MQLIAENRCGRALLFLVLLLNRCSGKAKENRLRERFFNADQHIAESGSMGFIHNKNRVCGFLVEPIVKHLCIRNCRSGIIGIADVDN